MKTELQTYFKTNADLYLTSLQIRSAPHRPGLPGPAPLLFNLHIRNIMPAINMSSMNADSDYDYHVVLVERQAKADKSYYKYTSIAIEFITIVQ